MVKPELAPRQKLRLENNYHEECEESMVDIDAQGMSNVYTTSR
jgi:hypothetical protein